MKELDKVYESVCKEDFYPNFEIVKQKKDANGFTILEVTGDDKKGVVDYAKQVLGYKVRSANKIESNKYVIYTGNKENLKEELKVDAKYIKTLKDNNIDFEKVGDKLLVDESNDKVLSGLGIPYRELFEVRFNNGQTKRFSKYSDAQIYAGNRKKLKPVIVDLSKEKESLDNLYESVYIENAKGRDDLLDAIQSYISSPQLKNYRVQSRRGDKLSAAADDNIYEIIIK